MQFRLYAYMHCHYQAIWIFIFPFKINISEVSLQGSHLNEQQAVNNMLWNSGFIFHSKVRVLKENFFFNKFKIPE